MHGAEEPFALIELKMYPHLDRCWVYGSSRIHDRLNIEAWLLTAYRVRVWYFAPFWMHAALD